VKPILRAVVIPLVAAGAIGASVAAGIVPSALAEPYPDLIPAPDLAPPMPWTQLGLPDRIDLIGSNQSTDIALPVPAGVWPTTLSGSIGSVVNLADARVDVLDGRGTLLSTIAIPDNATVVPFMVDIAPAEVIEGRAPLSFVLRDSNPTMNSCTQPPSLTMSQMSAAFSGPTPDPFTVAGFLPGYLSQITITVGPQPTVDAQQAALNLVADLTHLYRPMPVRIDVVAADTTAPSSPSSRVIDIRDGGPAGVSVRNPGTPAATLAITGTGDELIEQAELFADRRFGLAQTPTATVLAATEARAQSTNIKTFEQLGMTGQASVLGTTTMYAGFDAGEFGVGSISNAKVHLKARYTPVVGGEASVLIRSGSTVLATHRLDESGVLDITGDIPAESITSNIGMSLELRYLPQQECAPLNNRMTFALDPQSTVTVTPGTRNRGGFPVLPMNFNPDFDVAIDDPGLIVFAAQAINLMGQQSTVTLRPNVTTFDHGAATSVGLLAVTAGDKLAQAGMQPPLLPTSPKSLNVNGSPDTDVDLNGDIGVVQAFTQNGRTVVAVSGTGDWSLVNRSFDYIRGLPNRWGSLTGDVVATGMAGESVNLTLREGGAMTNEYPGHQWKLWALLSAAVGVGALIAAGAFIVVRRRRVSH
jgi:hypothetical protein